MIMLQNTVNMNLLISSNIMELFPIPFVLISHNKMYELNKNSITLQTLLRLSPLLLPPLPLFGMKLFSLQFTPSIGVLHPCYITKQPINVCLAHPQTIATSRYLVVLVLFLQPHERTKLQPCSQLCYFLSYGIKQNSYKCYDPFAKRLWISRHVVFQKHKMFHSLSRFTHVSTIPKVDSLSDLFLESCSIAFPNIKLVALASVKSPSSTPTKDLVNIAS